MLGDDGVTVKAQPLLPSRNRNRKERVSREEVDCRAAGGGTTANQAFLAFIKAVVGGGVFALPSAIRASGLLLGSAATLVMAVLSWYSTRACLNCVNALRARGVARHIDGRIEFTHLTEQAFPSFAAPMTFLCILTQYGAVISFFAFVADNVVPLSNYALEPWHVVVGMGALVAPLALLRETSHPAFGAVMAFGNMAIAAALVCVLYYGCLKTAQQGLPEALSLYDSSGGGLLFGGALPAHTVSRPSVHQHTPTAAFIRRCITLALLLTVVGVSLRVV